ncbi:MAG: pyruvate dehydrogenase complex dihydrolipoamide acetyltransferase [Caulobacteraceae bacterium]
MTDILMPALSPTMEEGALAKWLVKVGDPVKSGDVIAEIETDKATMEVEAVDEGVLEAILVPEGTQGVKVNAPIARLSGGESPPAPPAAPIAPQQIGSSRPERSEEPGPRGSETPPPGPTPTHSRGSSQLDTLGPGSVPGPATAGASGRISASPLAKRLAAQRGLELGSIKGSGPHGRIIRRDVEAAAGETRAFKAAAAASAAPAQVRSLGQMGIAPGSYDLLPLDGMRRTVARRMTDSFRDVPHFPLTVDIEIDALLAARASINTLLKKDGGKVSVNDLVIKAAATALMRVPQANASWSPEGIAMHHHADIAMAVAIDGGLITPIIRAAETKGVAAIAREAKDLAERARGRKLKPEEYLGGTFSVSNLGMFGIKSFASIVNEPQGAILSVGAGEKRAVVHGDAVAVATVMTVTLTCDHRVVDGAIGARWLAAFKAMIADPITMIV